MAEQDEEEMEFTKKKGPAANKWLAKVCVAHIYLFMHGDCVCVCVFQADVPPVDGPLSSIK